MMRGLVLWLLLVAALCTAAVILSDLPGMMRFEWLGYRVTMATSAFVGLLLLVLFLIGWLAGLWSRLRTWPERKRMHRALGRQQQGIRALTQAAVALSTARPDDAKKHIGKARRYLGDAPITLLLQAQLHEKQDESGKASDMYARLCEHEDTAQIGLRGLLQSAEHRGDYPRALTLAQEGIAQFPKDRVLLVHVLELMLRERALDSAEALLSRWRTCRLLPREQRRHIEALTLLLRADDADVATRIGLLSRAHVLAPGHRYIGLAYIRALLDAQDARLRKALHRAWYHWPSPELTMLALQWLRSLPEARRKKEARKLAKEASEHLESHLLLAYDAELRGSLQEAREHAEEALALRESRRALQLIAEIESEHGAPALAQPWYARATAAAQEELWVCRHCGHAEVAWHLFCPHCDRCDSAELQLGNTYSTHIQAI